MDTGQDTPTSQPEESIEQFLKRMAPRLQWVLRCYEIPPQDADDLLQDTFVEVVRKWGTLYNREGWLLGTLRFKCTKYWKDLRANLCLTMDAPRMEKLCPPLPPPQEKQTRMHDLRKLMRQVDRRHRRVLWLRFAVGFSPQEVADRLGYCQGSIRKLTLRATEKIRSRASLLAAPAPGVPDLDLD